MGRNDEFFEDGDFLMKNDDDEKSVWSLILHFHWPQGYSTLLEMMTETVIIDIISHVIQFIVILSDKIAEVPEHLQWLDSTFNSMDWLKLICLLTTSLYLMLIRNGIRVWIDWLIMFHSILSTLLMFILHMNNYIFDLVSSIFDHFFALCIEK